MATPENILPRRANESLAHYEERKRVIAEAKRRSREGKLSNLTPIVPGQDETAHPSPSNKRMGVEGMK